MGRSLRWPSLACSERSSDAAAADASLWAKAQRRDLLEAAERVRAEVHSLSRCTSAA
jgi:hypothetical protein